MKLAYSLIIIISFGYIANTSYADDCTPIIFNKGSYSGTVSGVAEPTGFGIDSGPLCYTISVNKGQHMNVSLLAGHNTLFSIVGEVDGETEYSFITKKNNYKILVNRFGSSRTPVPFDLTVTVR